MLCRSWKPLFKHHQPSHNRAADGPASYSGSPLLTTCANQIRAVRTITRGTYASDESYEMPDWVHHPLSTGSGSEEEASNMGGNSPDPGNPLPKLDFGKFVNFFRGASPYISGHRDRTFVVVIPGNVSPHVTHVMNHVTHHVVMIVSNTG